jgi:uncharacterized protein YceH (UPF0502 family)
MTAIEIIQSILPSWRESPPRAKRCRSSSSCGMEVEDTTATSELTAAFTSTSSSNTTTSPCLLISRALANHGYPDRLNPLSMDYLMDFDYDDGDIQRHIPADILMAIQEGNVNQFIHNYHQRDLIMAQRNSQGETLLHLACQSGCFSIVKFFLRDVKVSALVLDQHGRSPLHSLCMAIMNMNCSNDVVNDTPKFNHLETMRILLQEKPTLILFKDKQGKTPLEYIQQLSSTTCDTNKNVTICKNVNEMLHSDRVVERIVEEMSNQMEKIRSRQQMTTWEKIESMLDISGGVEAAVMESGFSI